jgi:anaerobic magnesium-protoporphyrin IX monomethyl ester cyclase
LFTCKEVVGIRFLLLNPPAESAYVKEGRCQHRAAVFSSVYPPMTLAYMASMLRGRADVLLLDGIGSRMPLDEVKARFREFKPDYVVCNTTTPTFLNDMRVLGELKKVHDCRVFVYGVHATALWRRVLEHEPVDGVVIGEPELTVSELAEKDLSGVKGIAFKRDGEVVKNPEREFMDLSMLPPPAWDLVDLSNYRVPVYGSKYVLVTTGRGCPFGCSFCVSHPYYGRTYRRRRVGDIINEVKYALSLGVRDFFFFAETFTLDKGHVLELCDALISEGINVRWLCNSRVDTVDGEMMSKMREAGCWMISFGLESSSQKILDNVNKGVKVEDSRKAVESAHKAGLAAVGHFIFGLPGETKQTVEDTIRFSLELPLDFAEYYVATPFPGSRLYDELEDRLGEVGWDSFEYATNIISTDIDLAAARSRAYRRFYLRPRTASNMLRIFGVNNLPLLIKTGFKFMCNI